MLAVLATLYWYERYALGLLCSGLLALAALFLWVRTYPIRSTTNSTETTPSTTPRPSRPWERDTTQDEVPE